MFGILSTIYSFIYNSLLDFVFFVLVDVVAKAPLREATSDSEKRTIWLYESLVLSALSFLVYVLDHVPYLLLVLTAVTFTYTQLSGRADLRRWGVAVRTRWEEYQQHEESMEIMREQLSRQRQTVLSTPVSFQTGAHVAPSFQNVPHVAAAFQQYCQQTQPMAAAVAGPGAYTQNQSAVPLVSQRQEPSKKEQRSWFWSRPTKWLGLNQKGPQTTVPGASANVRLESSSATPKRDAPVKGRQLEENAPQSASFFNGKDLSRRPLRAETSTLPPKPVVALSGLYAGTSSTIRTKFMSAFGMTSHAPQPPGLANRGRNLCFLNSILQAVSRSPHLATSLTVGAVTDLECATAESLLLTTLAETLHQCTRTPGSDRPTTGVLDPVTFRQAVSALNSGLVAPLGQAQAQQDAAEFLMWLLETVHNVLNKNRKALRAGTGRFQFQIIC